MKKTYYTSLLFWAMLFIISMSHSQNIITNGDFSSTTNLVSNFNGPLPANVWATWQGNRIDATAAIVNQEFKYQIHTAGNNTYEVQLIQTGFSLVPGHSYKLSFDVKADTTSTFGVFLGENNGNWTSLIGANNYIQHATTQWRTISIDFDVFTVFPNHKLSFELGTVQTSIFFDNVQLIDLGVQKKETSSELNKNIGMPGFRPESALDEVFLNSYKESTFIIYPTISRITDTTTWSGLLSEGFAQILKRDENLNIRLDENLLHPGELKGKSQFEFFTNDMAQLGKEIKKKKEQIAYCIIPEIVFEPRRQGTLFVFGIHIFILNNKGENVFSFLLNSHHELFVKAKLFAYNPNEKDLEALKQRSLEVGARAFRLMVN